MANWFADESFWKTFYPVLFTKERFEVAGEQIDKILALVGFKGNSILDLACGPGRHTMALASLGFKVTGVDLSPFLLGKARQRASEASVEIEWIHEDMRNFKRSGGFDLALSLFTSFGYFEDPKDDLKVLRNVYQSLVNGGVFLIDIVGKEWLARHFVATSSHKLPDGSLMIERREILDDWSQIHNRWILLREGIAVEYHFRHRLYSAQELKDRLEQTGFDQVRIYGDLEGNEYGLEAKRLIAVAVK